MYTLLKKELRFFFSNATGYVVISLFLLAVGLFLWVIPGAYNVLDAGYAQVDGLFQLAPWLFMFLCPAITMRFFSEEKQNHTWDWLRSQPISRISVVVGKFMAGWIVSLLSLLPCSLYYFTVSRLASPVGNVDVGTFWGAFLGLVFLTAINTAIGTFASSLTRNQVVAFMLASALCFLSFYGFDLVAGLMSSGVAANALNFFGIHAHYGSISRGVVDLSDVTYFISTTVLFTTLAIARVNK